MIVAYFYDCLKFSFSLVCFANELSYQVELTGNLSLPPQIKLLVSAFNTSSNCNQCEVEEVSSTTKKQLSHGDGETLAQCGEADKSFPFYL